MLIKARTIPLKLRILAAILRRLPLSHQKYQAILEEFKRREAGYQGEVSFDYYLRSLPKEKYMILHDINLPDGEYNCQIDSFLLTPEFGLIIDVKNMAGKLIFDTENGQFIQINNGKEKGYPDPIAQAERHKDFIKKWLAKNGFPPVPIDYMVVISNPFTTYVVTGPNAYKVKPRVCKGDAFLGKIQFFEKLYSAPSLNQKEIRKSCRLLLKMNTPPTSYLLNKFGIKKTDLQLGCQCPNCNFLPLIRKKQQWFCPSCQTFSKDAHINALQDYFLLVDLKITNQEFREFVQLSSSYVAKRLLQNTYLNFSGEKRHRVYFPKTFPW